MYHVEHEDPYVHCCTFTGEYTMCLCNESPSKLKDTFDAAKEGMDEGLVQDVMRGISLTPEVAQSESVLRLRQAWTAYKPFYEMRGR